MALSYAGMSVYEISRQLGVSRDTVYRWLNRMKAGNHSLRDGPRGAPPKRTTAAEDQLIIATAKKQSVMNAEEIKQQLQLSASVDTVRKRLHDAGLHYPDRPGRETLRDNHKNARIRFATEHSDEGLDYWARVIFSSEKSFSLNSTGELRCWRRNEPR